MEQDFAVDETVSATTTSKQHNDQQRENNNLGSIVFVSQQFPPDRSGHASRIDGTTASLASNGWDVTVLAPPASFPHGEFERNWRRSERTTHDRVTVIRLWSWQPTDPDPGFLSRLSYYVLFALHATVWLLFNRHKYDILVSTTPPISTGIAGLIPGPSRPDWVIDVRDCWIDASISLGFIPEGGVLERLSRAFQRRALATADRIAVTTQTLGEQLCEQYGEELSAKLIHVPNGVDCTRFNSRTDGGNVIDAQRGTEDIDTAAGNGSSEAVAGENGSSEAVAGELIYTGNIGHAQNLDDCIRALQYLPADVTLKLVGGGDAMPELQDLVEELDVADRVEFVGTVPHHEIPKLLDDATVGLAPLRDDPELAYAMPSKVYEYLGSGLPVIVTGQGEIERFVRDSGGGLHADNDAASIAADVEQLLQDDEFRVATAERGYEYVEKRYDRDNITDRFSDHLATLVESED